MNIKNYQTEVRVGIFLLIGIVLAVFLVFFLVGKTKSDKETYPLSIVFKDAAGIIKGASIRQGGAVIGSVSSVPELSDIGDRVVLHVRIDDRYKLQQGCEFRIGMQSLLGDKFIEVVSPEVPTTNFIAPGSLVYGQAKSDLDTLKSNAVVVSDELAKFMQDLSTQSPDIRRAIVNIADAAGSVNETAKIVNSELLTPKNIAHYSKVMENLEATSNELPLLMAEVRATVQNVKQAVDSGRLAADDARAMIGTLKTDIDLLQPSIKALPNTLASFAQAANEFKTLFASVNKGKGALGMVIADTQAKKDLQDFFRNLREYGILRYRKPGEVEPMIDPRSGQRGTKR